MRISPNADNRQWLARTGCAIRACLAVLLTATIAAQDRPAQSSLQGQGGLKVMTYNMYAGTEYAGVTNPDLNQHLQAVTNMLLDARASDPAGRAQAIARQIASTMPHLVSLQEVATWSSGPTKEDQTLEFDYLQLLLDALKELGMSYTPVNSVTTWDVTLLSSLGFYVHHTWRVAVIARADLKPEDFSITNAQGAPWSSSATLSYWIPALDGRPDLCPSTLINSTCMMPFPRGWVSADITYRGKQFRYIDAHLESRSASRNFREGQELLNGPANTTLPVIIGADLNCDLANPSDTKYPTCVLILNAGFNDAWGVVHPSEPG
jgi:endonuclease/exonuclease/phosphatase family metal-dependent hydrolase